MAIGLQNCDKPGERDACPTSAASLMGVRRGAKRAFAPPLEIGTKKAKFLENVKSAV